MPLLTIRKLDQSAYDLLRARAARNHRSLEGELRAVLTEIAEDERTQRTITPPRSYASPEPVSVAFDPPLDMRDSEEELWSPPVGRRPKQAFIRPLPAPRPPSPDDLAAAETLLSYPDEDKAKLTEQYAKRLGVPPEPVILLCGLNWYAQGHEVEEIIEAFVGMQELVHQVMNDPKLMTRVEE